MVRFKVRIKRSLGHLLFYPIRVRMRVRCSLGHSLFYRQARSPLYLLHVRSNHRQGQVRVRVRIRVKVRVRASFHIQHEFAFECCSWHPFRHAALRSQDLFNIMIEIKIKIRILVKVFQENTTGFKISTALRWLDALSQIQ